MAINKDSKVQAQKAAVAAAKAGNKSKGYGLKTIQRNELAAQLNQIEADGGEVRFILPNGGSWNTYDVIFKG